MSFKQQAETSICRFLPSERNRIDNHAVPRSHYIRWGHHHERPSGSGQTAPPTAGRTPWIVGPQSWPALASPLSTKCGWGRSNKVEGGWQWIQGWWVERGMVFLFQTKKRRRRIRRWGSVALVEKGEQDSIIKGFKPCYTSASAC